MKKETLERKLSVNPAFDKRDPNPKKDYGIHSCELVFELKGKEGTIIWRVFTGWHLPHIRKKYFEEQDIKGFEILTRPMGAWLDFHSRKKLEGCSNFVTDKCIWLDGKKCYIWNFSTLYSEELFGVLQTKGSDEIWKILEEQYRRITK